MSQTPGVFLRFVVVGGGMAGLAAAYALQKAGHDVVVLEKRLERYNLDSGVALEISPPNMTKIIKQWGIGTELLATAGRHTCTNFIDGEDGTHIGALTSAVFEVVQKDSMADFIMMKRSELYDLLYESATQQGVTIRFDSPVVRLEALEDRTRVHLRNCQSVDADVVIAADGFNSTIRREVVMGHSEPANQSTVLLLKTSTSIEDMERHGLMPTGSKIALDLYLGDGFFCHAGAQGDTYFLISVVPYSNLIEAPDHTDWTEIKEVPREVNEFISSRFSKQLQHVIELSKSKAIRVHGDPGPPDSLVCPSARTILVGEAAHITNQGGYHSTALSFEDAETLRYLFSRIQDRRQILKFLSAYDEIRHARASYIHESNERRLAILKAPKGAMREARDNRIREVTVAAEKGEIDEHSVMEGWGDHVLTVMYDATEKAEDWWLQLGQSVVKSPVRSRLSVSMQSLTHAKPASGDN